jgi:hypothetical protein
MIVHKQTCVGRSKRTEGVKQLPISKLDHTIGYEVCCPECDSKKLFYIKGTMFHCPQNHEFSVVI